mgnify:CR=1 FL=1
MHLRNSIPPPAWLRSRSYISNTALARARPVALLLAAAFAVSGCSAREAAPHCRLVENGFGEPGTVGVQVETVVSGLEVPWAIAFRPSGDALVTERPGRLRLVRDIA